MCRKHGCGMHRASTDIAPRLYTVHLRFAPLELVAVRRVRSPPPGCHSAMRKGTDGRALAVALAAALAAVESSVVKIRLPLLQRHPQGLEAMAGSLEVLRICPSSSCAFSRAIHSTTPMVYDPRSACHLFRGWTAPPLSCSPRNLPRSAIFRGRST